MPNHFSHLSTIQKEIARALGLPGRVITNTGVRAAVYTYPPGYVTSFMAIDGTKYRMATFKAMRRKQMLMKVYEKGNMSLYRLTHSWKWIK